MMNDDMMLSGWIIVLLEAGQTKLSSNQAVQRYFIIGDLFRDKTDDESYHTFKFRIVRLCKFQSI